MAYAHDTEVALVAAAALVNTLVSAERDDHDPLATRAGLDAFLTEYPYSARIDGDDRELREVRAMRPRVHALWTAADKDAAVAVVNDLLRATNARPYLSRHDEWDWHLHVTDPTQPLAEQMGAEAAMAVADLIRADDLQRLRICEAPDCEAVLVDLSRNRSRRFCDTGNCGNRLNVAAYRARKASAS
ncbi:CGNR zinc finger domain-containing protein [Spongisporangium articulatum]|uniref:CGNR zinc finger domain-containing protein n=1 Tax=Spongisporangium articulatum TaxID=3362603 RepID=A0ABW8AR00_9ACTN